MSARISKLKFATPTLTAEAACATDFAGGEAVSEPGPLQNLLYRLYSDEQLALELQGAHGDALTELFRRHSGLLFGICRRILRSEEETEDVVQLIFLEVFRSIQQFDPQKGSFKTWLLMFAYHRTLNYRRAMAARRIFATDSLDTWFLESEASQVASRYTPVEAQVLVKETLALLPERERRTIELVYDAGLTAEEISRRTGESVRVVRHNLYRGLEKLRKALCPANPAKQTSPKGGRQ